MPLFQLIFTERSPLKQEIDPETRIDSFECGKVKGYVSPSARKELDKEVYSVGDFKVAMVSIKETEPKPWLLYVPPTSKLAIRNLSLQQTADLLLKIGKWRDAFPYAKSAMERSMAELGKTFKDDYDILKKDPEENPETGFISTSLSKPTVSIFYQQL